MFHTNVIRRHGLVLLAGLLAITLSAHVAASVPAETGFGQSRPNSPNVGLNARWPVYVFHRQGVDYVQVNDANGRVRVAFAHMGNQFLVLPAGADIEHVSTPQQREAAVAALNSEIVYRDAQIQVSMIPQAGATTWAVTTVPQCGPECGNDARTKQANPTVVVPPATTVQTAAAAISATNTSCGPECGNDSH